MHYTWERLGAGTHRCRLPFLDVTVGVVQGSSSVLMVDSGSTLTEGIHLAADVTDLTGSSVSHLVLTHRHFDHVLGSAAFATAQVYTSRTVADAMTAGAADLIADAVRYGADEDAVTAAAAALRPPNHVVGGSTVIDLGDRHVRVIHPGRGHTADDLVVVVTGPVPVVFCGDLVEESGDPAVDDFSDLTAWPATLDRLLDIGGPDALYVPGHGAVVDAHFVAGQRDWLRRQPQP